MLFSNVLFHVLFWYYLPKVIIFFLYHILQLVQVSIRHFSFAFPTLNYPASKPHSCLQNPSIISLCGCKRLHLSLPPATKIQIGTWPRFGQSKGPILVRVLVDRSNNILSFQGHQWQNKIKCPLEVLGASLGILSRGGRPVFTLLLWHDFGRGSGLYPPSTAGSICKAWF